MSVQPNGRDTQAIFRWSKGNLDIKPYLKQEAGLTPAFNTALEALFSADCMMVLPVIEDEVIDTVFADPPFNLGKEYGKNTDDLQPDDIYLRLLMDSGVVA